MLDFLKKDRKREIAAPVSGKTVKMENVPDMVFAQKILGDGIAIEPSDNLVVAPFDGKVESLMANSGHAIGLANKEGIELLIHIGIDTVSLNGKGFEVLKKEGDKVKKGTPLVRFDMEYIKSQGLNPMTMVILTNSNDYQLEFIDGGQDVNAGDLIMSLKK